VESLDKRSLSTERYVYWWADGVYTGLRDEDTDKQCLLVIMGVKPDGSKERVAIGNGFRESKESWRGPLLDLKERGFATRARYWQPVTEPWGSGPH